MSEIEIPYLPINSFEESVVCENLAKTCSEISNDLSDTVNDGLVLGEELSKDVALVLHGMGMEKYLSLFQNQDISLETFLQLNETDLHELGITNPSDRGTIVRNLEIHQLNINNFVIPENRFEDLKITKNLFNQLLLIQNYCAFIELQMKKNKFTDYRISWKETAGTYLKAFIRSAITQSKILSCSLFVESHSDHLIGKLVKMYDLTLPNHLQEKLKVKKRSKKSDVLRVIVVVGFCSIVILIGKCLWRRQ